MSLRFRNAFPVMALACALAAGAEVRIDATTPEGDLIRGRIADDAGFEFEGSLGRVHLSAAKVKSVLIDAGEAVVTLDDSSVLHGKMSAAVVKVRWAGGEAELDVAKLRRADFLVPNAAAPPGIPGTDDFAGPPEWKTAVSAETVDRMRVRGMLREMTRVEMDTAFGRANFELWQIRSIVMDGTRASLVTKSGSNVKGTLLATAWKIHGTMGDVEIATEKLKSIAFMQAAATAEEEPPAVPGVSAPGWPDDMKEVAMVEGPMTLAAAPQLAPGGKRLVMLEGEKKRKLVSIDTETFKVAQEVALSDDVTAFSVAPSGKIAFASGGRFVTQVDLNEGKVLRRFEIEVDLYGIVALSDDVALAPDTVLQVISASRQGIIRAGGKGGGAYLHLPSRNLLFSGQFSTALPAEVGKAEDLRLESIVNTDRVGVPPRCWATSDSRFLLAPDGICYRIGNPGVASLARTPDVVGDVTAAADFPKAGRWFVFRKHELVEVSLPSLTITHRIPLKVDVGAALAVEASETLYVFAGDVLKIDAPPGAVLKSAGPGRWKKLHLGK